MDNVLRKVISLCLLTASLFMTSCVASEYVAVDEVYADEYTSSVDVNMIITYGTPFYHGTSLWYYYYNGLYYYPFYYDNYWYFRPYTRIYPWGYDFRFRPTPRDYRFRPHNDSWHRPHHPNRFNPDRRGTTRPPVVNRNNPRNPKPDGGRVQPVRPRNNGSVNPRPNGNNRSHFSTPGRGINGNHPGSRRH